MGRRGPKPEPAAVKEAKGNPSRRKVGSDPQAAEAGLSKVEAPAWLENGGLDVWRRLAPRLVALKLLTPTDAETFARYCKNFARWLTMQERMDKMGEIYEIVTASGTVRRADPAFLIGDRLERQLISAEAVFGLNPAERQRIYAARAANPAGEGDLFANRASQPTAQPTAPQAAPRKGAVGFLQ